MAVLSVSEPRGMHIIVLQLLCLDDITSILPSVTGTVHVTVGNKSACIGRLNLYVDLTSHSEVNRSLAESDPELTRARQRHCSIQVGSK
jgi:hypothetical protein